MTYIGQQPATTFDAGIQDRFTGLSTNTVTLTHEIAAEEDILVVWNNIVQDKNTYSVAGTGNKTLTLGGTLVSADVVTVYYLNKVMQSVNPTANSVGITELNVSDGSNGQALTTNGSGTLSFATTGGDLSFGGDTFGADKTIGSNDAYALSFETNNAVGLKIDNAGHVTKPLQTAVVWKPTNNSAAVSADTSYTVGSGSDSATEIIDRNGDFSGHTFTAPITGIYFLSASIHIQSYDHDNNYSAAWIETSNRQYRLFQRPNGAFAVDGGYQFAGGFVADMDASDTATWVFRNDQGTSQPYVTQERSIFGAWLLG